jgi:hypothetical protein
MLERELKDDDVFHVIGFTRENVARGMQLRTMRLSEENLKAGMLLHQRLGNLSAAAQRGLVVKKLVEVYFLDPFSFFEDDTFEKRFGDKYQVVEFYNEDAFTLCEHYHIELPPVIDRLMRADLPKPLGTSMQFPCFLLA